MVRNHHTPPSPDPAGSGTESKVTHPFTPTPGPWVIVENSQEFEIWSEPDPRNSSTARLIATVWKAEYVPDPEARKFIAEVSHSNARLLAIAPRMLTLLRERIQLEDEIDPSGWKHKIQALDAHSCRVRTLLAELEGGAL